MFYLKILLVTFWVIFGFIYGILVAIFRFGDQNLNFHVSKVISWGVLKITGIRVKLEGQENLESAQPCVYVANHQSAMDIITFGSIFPHRSVVVGKKELLWVPPLNLYFIAAKNIAINRGKHVSAIQSISRAVEAIQKEKISVWLFAEGTRNRTSEPLLPFKKGAFYMAIESGVPVVPIVSAPIGSLVSWKNKRLVPGDVSVRVLAPVSTKGLTYKDIDRLISDVRNQMIVAVKEMSEVN